MLHSYLLVVSVISNLESMSIYYLKKTFHKYNINFSPIDINNERLFL